MLWLIAVSVIIAVTAYAVAALFKFLTARIALRDVPPEQRVEVIDALGRCFERWRR